MNINGIAVVPVAIVPLFVVLRLDNDDARETNEEKEKRRNEPVKADVFDADLTF